MLAVFVYLLGCEYAYSEISMVCIWYKEGANKESFVFNLDKKTVYWVNENQRIKLTSINEGRIIFKGEKSGYGMGNSKTNIKFPIEFNINRITGQLSIKGIAVPAPNNSNCRVTQKII